MLLLMLCAVQYVDSRTVCLFIIYYLCTICLNFSQHLSLFGESYRTQNNFDHLQNAHIDMGKAADLVTAIYFRNASVV